MRLSHAALPAVFALSCAGAYAAKRPPKVRHHSRPGATALACAAAAAPPPHVDRSSPPMTQAEALTHLAYLYRHLKVTETARWQGLSWLASPRRPRGPVVHHHVIAIDKGEDFFDAVTSDYDKASFFAALHALSIEIRLSLPWDGATGRVFLSRGAELYMEGSHDLMPLRALVIRKTQLLTTNQYGDKMSAERASRLLDVVMTMLWEVPFLLQEFTAFPTADPAARLIEPLPVIVQQPDVGLRWFL